MAKQQYEIVELGKLGKEGKLWSIEIFYERNNEVSRIIYRNQTNEQVMKMRDAIFRVGFIVPVKDQHGVPVAGSFQIIPPLYIHEAFLHRQADYFKE